MRRTHRTGSYRYQLRLVFYCVFHLFLWEFARRCISLAYAVRALRVYKEEASCSSALVYIPGRGAHECGVPISFFSSSLCSAAWLTSSSVVELQVLFEHCFRPPCWLPFHTSPTDLRCFPSLSCAQMEMRAELATNVLPKWVTKAYMMCQQFVFDRVDMVLPGR